MPRIVQALLRGALAGAVTTVAIACAGPPPTSIPGLPEEKSPSQEPGESGLPCEVDALLESSCRSCHGKIPTAHAPISLVTYEDLAAPSSVDASLTVAERSLQRMQSETAPMPPGALLPAGEVAVLADWIAAGMPRGTCAPGGGAEVALDPICSSGRFWSGGTGEDEGEDEDEDEGGSGENVTEDATRQLMYPGRPCIHCHTTGDEDGPPFLVAGTVYPSGRELDDCFGAQGITVEVIDAFDRTFGMTTNLAGNFFYEGDPGSIAMPIRARVVAGGEVRAMSTAVESGDCNTCHGETGKNGAPGRITAP
jgi:hypothetical protein